jgi:hypothetical protein
VKSKKTPPRAPATKPATGVLHSDDLLSLPEVVAFLADRVRGPLDTVREARDKVRKRMVYAVDNGTLRQPEQQRFRLIDVVTWARGVARWAPHLTDFPVVIAVPAARLTLTGYAPVVYSSPEGKRIAELEQELAEARAELELLRPDAVKWRSFATKCGKGKSRSRREM